MQKDPVKTNRVSHPVQPIHVHSMQDWEDGGETEADEHACSERSPSRRSKLWVHGYNSASDADCRYLRPSVQEWFVGGLRFIPTYHTPVDSLQHGLAIEAIIYARHEASRDQNDDAQVIDLIPPLIDLRDQCGPSRVSRVAVPLVNDWMQCGT